MAKYKRRRVQQSFEGIESMTQQSDKPFTSIRNILRRGVEPPSMLESNFGDFTSAEDFQQSMERLADAQSQFAALPSEVRDYFDNDPKNLIQAIEDISNDKDPRTREDLEKMGIIRAKQPPPTVPGSDEKEPGSTGPTKPKPEPEPEPPAGT